MPRPMHCADCGSSRRSVSLWDQILSPTGGTVCCWSPVLPEVVS